MTLAHPALAVLVALAVLPNAATAQTQADLIGTWTLNMPKPACTLTRTFRADGSIVVVNGEKRTEGTFVFRPGKGAGAPTVVYTVSKDAGGRDCDGSSADTTGKRYLFYVEIDRIGLRTCFDSARTSCLGPYLRR